MSASKRKPIRKPGKKTGARINHTLVLKPLGLRNMITYELPARTAIVAIQSGVQTSDHLAYLYSLGDIASRIATEPHIRNHAASVMRMCDQIYQAGGCGALMTESMRISTDILMRWLNEQNNHSISLAAASAIRELA